MRDETSALDDLEAATAQVVETAKALGVEIDEAEAERWIDAVSDDSIGNVTVDMHTGVYGHRVTMADLDATGLDRFRRMALIVGFVDEPPRVMTALALSGSAAQARIQRFPADADFFERVHIQADTRDEACHVLATVMRDKALATMRGDGHRLQEVKFGNWPIDGSLDGAPVKRGTPVSWTPAQVETGGIAFRAADGTEAALWWDDAALDPGWCKLDWVIEDSSDHALVNVSNMLDVTWEAPDGAITPLDGFLDSYFQEVYLETESIPLFSKLVKEMGADAVADYVETLNHEIWKYTTKDPNYGKAARRLYNVFRLTGQYAEAAYIRELFDEPVTALYQVAALLRTLDEASAGDDSSFGTEAMVAEFDGLIMSAIGALEGPAEEEMVRRLLRLRDAFSHDVESEGRSADLEEARSDAMREVDAYFKRVLEAVPSINAYLAGLAAA
ncbi:MAG: hypothetical protein ABIZ52_06630 [Candidatus Limnocylindrales bacterium]